MGFVCLSIEFENASGAKLPIRRSAQTRHVAFLAIIDAYVRSPARIGTLVVLPSGASGHSQAELYRQDG